MFPFSHFILPSHHFLGITSTFLTFTWFWHRMMFFVWFFDMWFFDVRFFSMWCVGCMCVGSVWRMGGAGMHHMFSSSGSSGWGRCHRFHGCMGHHTIMVFHWHHIMIFTFSALTSFNGGRSQEN